MSSNRLLLGVWLATCAACTDDSTASMQPVDPAGPYELALAWSSGQCAPLAPASEQFTVIKGGTQYVVQLPQTPDSLTGGITCQPSECDLSIGLTEPAGESTETSFVYSLTITATAITGAVTFQETDLDSGAITCSDSATVTGER